MVLPVIRIPIEADATGAVRELDRTGDAIDQLGNRAPRTAGATNRLTGRLRGLGNVSRQTRARIQNTSFQLQDLIVQLQGGVSASTALAQQLPQLLGAFGALGAVAGVAAGITIPAVSAAMSVLGSETRDLQELLEDLEDRVSDYIEASRRANLSTGELSEQFRELTPEIVAATRALAEFASRQAQNEIDALAESLSNLLGVGGAGEARTNVADFFDVSIVFAFTDAQRAAREEARQLTAEFVNAQRALQDAEGDIDAQAVALNRLLSSTQALAQAVDGVSDEENELIGQIAKVLEQTELHRNAITDASNEGQILQNVMASVNAVTTVLVATSENLAGPISEAAAAAGDLATNLFEAARARATIIQSAQARGGGRGGDPRQFGLGAGDLAAIRFGGGAFEADPDVPGADRRRGGGASGRGDIESLIEDLQTEQETIEQFRQQGLELLAEANAAELEAVGGQNEAKLRLQEEYMNRLRALQQREQSQTLNSYGTLFGNLSNVFAQGSGNILKVSKAFSIAQGLINSYRAYTEVLADPSLIGRPFLRTALAASTLASGLAQVASIRSVSDSVSGGAVGGGGGGAGAAAGGAAAAPQGQTFFNVNLTGEGNIGRGQVRGLIEMINEEIEDGAVLGGIRVSGA